MSGNLFLIVRFPDHCLSIPSSSTTPDADAIPVEVYKAGVLPMTEKLIEFFFHCVWRNEDIPKEFKDASMNHI